MTNTLYRWVKASERLPEHYKSVFIRRTGYEGGLYARWDGVWKVFVNDYHFGPHGRKPEGHEWLEPLPSPGDNQSLEEAAKNHCKKNYDPTLSGWESVVPFFLAGAAYVKGGEGLVDELRKANPYKNARTKTPQYRGAGWVEACDTLYDILNQKEAK